MSGRTWIPLLDYAVKKGVSLSTLRRHIKAGKVLYKIEDGRYLLFDDTTGEPGVDAPRLQSELERAHEEIAELKTLIAFYEERLPHSRPGA